jgi:hypothetical protein
MFHIYWLNQDKTEVRAIVVEEQRSLDMMIYNLGFIGRQIIGVEVIKDGNQSQQS